MPTVFGHSVGPTGGFAAVRAGAGYRTGTVSIFAGSSPGSFTRIQPSMTQAQIQSAIDNDTTGKVWWEKGTYRGPWTINDTAVFRLYTQADQEHRFETGPGRTAADTAIFQGSEPATGWTTTGDGYWQLTGQTQDFTSRHNIAGPDPYHNDFPQAGHQLEAYYRDGIQLIPAPSKAAVLGRSDAVYFDNTANIAWLGSTPTGHTMEKLGDFAYGFRIRVPNITFKGGIFRHSGFGLIHPEITGGGDPSGFFIEDAELCYARVNGNFNGGGANPEYTGSVSMNHCTIHHGGRYNFNQTWTTNSVISYCEIYAGNWLHFGNRVVGTFDEGSDKTLFTNGMTYHHNWIHDNDGPAVWGDTLCNGFTLEDNVLEHNFGAGIHYEASNGAVIRRNLFNDNQMDGNQPAPFDGTAVGWPTIGGWSYKGGAIWHSVSADVEIYDNWFYNNKHAAHYVRQDFIAPHGRNYNLIDTNFHHNRIDHWDSGSALEYMMSYRDSRLATEVPVVSLPAPPGYDPGANLEPYAPTMVRANNLWNFNDYHVRAAGREDAPSRPIDAWFFAPSGTNKSFTAWRQGFIVQYPSDIAGAGVDSKGSPAAWHDPSSTFATDLPGTPPHEPVDSSDGSINWNLLPVAEADTAQAIVTNTTHVLGQATETDIPLGASVVVVFGPGVTQAIAQASGTNTALSATPRTRGNFSDVATATTFASAFTYVIQTVVETDTAVALQGHTLATVEELDEVIAVDVRRRLEWTGPVTATTLPPISVDPVVIVAMGQASGTNTALAVTVGMSSTPTDVVDITFLAASFEAVRKGGTLDTGVPKAGTLESVSGRGDYDRDVTMPTLVYASTLVLAGSYDPVLTKAGSP